MGQLDRSEHALPARHHRRNGLSTCHKCIDALAQVRELLRKTRRLGTQMLEGLQFRLLGG